MNIGYHSDFMDRIIERTYKPKPMTNEEYIRSCSTEELPKALKKMFFDIKSRVRSELGGYNELMKSERYFDEWLKEIHDEVS